MRGFLLTLAVVALYVLHQDFWFWRDGTLVFGVMPIGLFYHALYCVASAVLMWALVTFAWPSDLDDLANPEPGQQPTTSHQQPL